MISPVKQTNKPSTVRTEQLLSPIVSGGEPQELSTICDLCQTDKMIQGKVAMTISDILLKFCSYHLACQMLRMYRVPRKHILL
jgi:hypothetical protein